MMRKTIKKTAMVLVLLLLAAAMAVPVSAFTTFSGYGYYPRTYISSAEGLVTPDLEWMYPAWAEYRLEYGDLREDDPDKIFSNTREDFLAAIAKNYRTYDDPNALSGLTFEQAAKKLAQDEPEGYEASGFQYIAGCALQDMDLEKLDFLVYKLDISDANKLNDGKVRVTIESCQSKGSNPGTLKNIVLTQNGAEILAATYVEGEHDLSGYYDGDYVLTTKTAVRTYALPVAAGVNEFVINDGYSTFKLLVNVSTGSTTSTNGNNNTSTGGGSVTSTAGTQNKSGSNIKSPPTGDNIAALLICFGVMVLAGGVFAVNRKTKKTDE